MHVRLSVIAALALVLAGCDSEAPVAQPPSASSAATIASPPTTSPSALTTSNSANRRPPAPPGSNVKDCFDGDCTLLLTKPTKIPLNAKTLHYSSMRVTAISAKSLSYTVNYPQGGGAQSTIGVGLAGSSFGFRGFPSIEVGLRVVGGKPALVLQRGAAS